MKLLNKSIRLYILYATIILLISIPLLYFAIQHVVSGDVDENLVVQKQKIINKLEKINVNNYPPYLESFESDITLKPGNEGSRKDTFYTMIYPGRNADENIPYRILISNIFLNGKPYTIQLKNSLLDSKDLIESIVTIVGVLLFFIVVGLVIINRRLSKKLWKPFYNTINKLHEFRIEKNESLHFEKTTITEFSKLNNAITSLTNRNQEVYQLQKEFTENASHEMQIPLAVFQSKVELLMQTAPINNEQAELIGELSQAGQRMNRLNKTLLLLAKIENNQFPEKEKIIVNETVNKLLDQYHDVLHQKNIAVQKDLHNTIVIQANRTLVEVLISNLLSNAIRHNNTGGALKISIGNNELIISNEGKSTALNTSRLFQRFQKETSDNNSIGLGLEIAKKICSLYGFNISYNFIGGLHSFSVRLSTMK